MITYANDLKNPSVFFARSHPSEYVIFFAPSKRHWQLERMLDKVIVASGTLEAMLTLLPLFPNSRRASWAEDMLRFHPSFLDIPVPYRLLPV